MERSKWLAWRQSLHVARPRRLAGRQTRGARSHNGTAARTRRTIERSSFRTFAHSNIIQKEHGNEDVSLTTTYGSFRHALATVDGNSPAGCGYWPEGTRLA